MFGFILNIFSVMNFLLFLLQALLFHILCPSVDQKLIETTCPLYAAFGVVGIVHPTCPVSINVFEKNIHPVWEDECNSCRSNDHVIFELDSNISVAR